MGIHVIRMPDIGEGIAEVELVGWHVKEGETVAEDQILADVMTDKANVEIPSPVAGTVLKLGGEVGKTMAVGSELIRLEVEGAGNVREQETSQAMATPSPRMPTAPTAPTAPTTVTATPVTSAGGQPIVDVTSPSGAVAMPPLQDPAAASGAIRSSTAPATAVSGTGAPTSSAPKPDPSRRAAETVTREPAERAIASPAVRRHAWDLGVELQFVRGTGPAGRIMHDDVDGYVAAREAPSPESRGGAGSVAPRYAERNDTEQIPVIGLRRRIAHRMQESKRRIPHFTYVEEIDVTEVEVLRAKLNARWAGERGKLTTLPFIARAMIVSIRDFPQVNATYDDAEGGGTVTRHGAVHLGVAAQTDQGLMVPVVRHAETMDIWAIGAEIARLADAARSGRAARDELSGSTITLTSLGALGGIVSTPVINHPEVAIVGVNRIVERPVIVSGAIVARKTMNLSSSFDHRIVDGMDAARFIQAIRGLLEAPAMLFVD